IIGPWLFLIALASIIYQSRAKKLMAETLTTRFFLAFTGVVCLGLGLLLVVSHNLWVAAWPVVITIVGWALIVQGFLRLFWPDLFSKIMRDLMANSGYSVMSWA